MSAAYSACVGGAFMPTASIPSLPGGAEQLRALADHMVCETPKVNEVSIHNDINVLDQVSRVKPRLVSQVAH